MTLNAPFTISAISTEYVKAPIGGSGDLATFPVKMAILPDGQIPGPSDWLTAGWTVEEGVLKAMILVGPATSIPLTRGVTYKMWVLITAEPEIPVLEPGTIHAT